MTLELQRAVEREYIDNGLEPTGYVYEELGERLKKLSERADAP